ncbi:MAG: response regulator transcription factor [Lachnospiraceae bacterium]|nr:response regulator transcription factor [Lachnospiraceae bacterium]
MEKKDLIYIVEDDERILEIENLALTREGLFTKTFESGEAFLDAIANGLPALVVLDIMLPGIDGLEILQRLKTSAETAKLPVILVTAKTSNMDEILGLDQGADDYITKPFDLQIFVSRVKAILRRVHASEVHNYLTVDGVSLDLEGYTCSVNGVPVELPAKEFELLALLLRNRGRALSRDTLLDGVWHTTYISSSRTLDSHVNRVRRKIGAAGEHIKTVWGIGYKWE